MSTLIYFLEQHLADQGKELTIPNTAHAIFGGVTGTLVAFRNSEWRDHLFVVNEKTSCRRPRHVLARTSAALATLASATDVLSCTVCADYSHTRYMDARGLLSTLKSGVTGAAMLVFNAGTDLTTKERKAHFEAHCRVLVRRLQMLSAAIMYDIRDSRQPAKPGMASDNPCKVRD